LIPLLLKIPWRRKPLGGFKTSEFAPPATPTPFFGISKTPRTGNGRKSFAFAQTEQIGFTPLARQLSDWMAPSPLKSHPVHSIVEQAQAIAQPSPAKSTFFDDEMTTRDEMEGVPEAPEALIDEVDFDPVELDDEDLSLAQEADELSLLEVEAVQEMQNVPQTFLEPEVQLENIDQAFEDLINDLPEEVDIIQTEEEIPERALSEASQEYGDENAIPMDPALFALPVAPAPATPKFFTPKRVLAERVFHTVSKVPLKAAADDTPMRPSPVKRSASISRLPVQRPSSNLARSNTVISYSPSKRVTRANSPDKDVEMQDACATPSKPEAEAWSSIGTPARTPRRDLNTALLKGAVVFVDVHTTEGADASALFTELLTQMGARCVKRWDWSGNSEDGKIGITHVVFKDGGKRTLEKARETGDVVSCVGVGWVLE
jgi:hypothetical protein